MSKYRIRELLRELDTELDRTDDLDDDTRRDLVLLGERLESADPEDDDSLSDTAGEMASRFAASHPTAARIARDIADMLAKMGI
jgi:hypothetical protein